MPVQLWPAAQHGSLARGARQSLFDPCSLVFEHEMPQQRPAELGVGVRELCYCGLNSVEIEHASFAVMGEVCCSRACYNEAIQNVRHLEVDGWHAGGYHVEPVAQPE